MSDPVTLFKALADPSRLRILALLRQSELAIGELADILGQSQPRVSRHVKILAQAALIHRHKEGALVLVRLSEDAPFQALFDAMQPLMSGMDALCQADRLRLETQKAERRAKAEAYFAENAVHWDRLRALHVAESAVESAVLAALPEALRSNVLDIGTGTGRMLELLGQSVSRAVGVDNSREMLRFARAKLESAGLHHCQVRLGDMYALEADGEHSAVIMHQVLHFAEAPDRAIASAARAVAQGGRLLIVDFAAHALEELRTEHAHRRLGFTDQQITDWLARAGLTARRLDVLKGDRLDVVLWAGDRAQTKSGPRQAMA